MDKKEVENCIQQATMPPAAKGQIKVAHVTTVDMSLRYLLLNQLKSIMGDGYHLTGISSPGEDVLAIEAAGVIHVAAPMTRKFTPLADLLSLWRLYRIMRRERFTIVHTHTPKPGLLGQLAARLAGVPIVVNTLHGFYFHDHMPLARRRFYIILEKIAARCSSAILSQNREDIRTAIQEEICLLEKIKHLGNGIDLELFNPSKFSPQDLDERRRQLGISESAPVVGFVGRLAAKRKGFLDFLRAGQQIVSRLPAVRFLIIGEADLGKPDTVDTSTADDFGIAGRCLLLGRCLNTELPILYQLMDVLVLPSLFEGFPRVVMEASAMGVPAVVTDVRGNREAVEHGCNGLLVPLNDVPALTDAILELLENPEEARRMGEIGRQMARERFDEQLVFAKVKAEYARLLRARNLALPPAAETGRV